MEMDRFRGKPDSAMTGLMHYKLRRKRTEGTLIAFIQAMVKRRVEIELRGDIIVKGLLVSVDAQMNCTLSSVMWRRLDDDKSRRKLKDLRVSGRQIVYVHIPDSVDVSKVLDSHFSRRKKAQTNAKKPPLKRVIETKNV